MPGQVYHGQEYHARPGVSCQGQEGHGQEYHARARSVMARSVMPGPVSTSLDPSGPVCTRIYVLNGVTTLMGPSDAGN